MATINFIGNSDPFDEAKELCLIIESLHKAGRKVEVHTRYTREQLESGVIKNVLFVRTAISKADKVVTA